MKMIVKIKAMIALIMKAKMRIIAWKTVLIAMTMMKMMMMRIAQKTMNKVVVSQVEVLYK